VAEEDDERGAAKEVAETTWASEALDLGVTQPG
jgi:hypothetical protein